MKFLMTGGATGADREFTMNAVDCGMFVSVFHFDERAVVSTLGDKYASRVNIQYLTEELLMAEDERVKELGKSLKRKPKTEYVKNLLRRNNYIVSGVDMVVAVGVFTDKWFTTLKGGTGWGVRFAELHSQCEIFVFDQELQLWFEFNRVLQSYRLVDENELVQLMGFYKTMAGIGTRELNTAGRAAIKRLFT